MKTKEHYEHQDVRKYYCSDHFEKFSYFFKDIPKEAKILNCGCGNGKSLLGYPNGMGIDFNKNLIPIWKRHKIENRCVVNSCIKMPFDNNQFDFTVSTDFLEHIPLSEIDLVLSEIIRVAPIGHHIIDLKEISAYRGPNNENLHCAGLNTTGWLQRLKKYGNVTSMTKNQFLQIIIKRF